MSEDATRNHDNVRGHALGDQAAMATFFAEKVTDWGERIRFFHEIARLALGHGVGIGLSHGPNRAVAESLPVDPDDYSDFLHSVGGYEYEPIKGRLAMLEAYDYFASSVDTLRQELLTIDKPENHPGFLGRGGNSVVFSITLDDKTYAVRLPYGDNNTDASTIDINLEGAVLGKGIHHLEQIIAASYVEGVTIAEIIPGREIWELTLDEVRSITSEQLSRLVDTIEIANKNGIAIDHKLSNVLYDPLEGFGIVDYGANMDRIGGLEEDLIGSVVWLEYLGSHDSPDYPQEVSGGEAGLLELKKAILQILQQYRLILESRLVDEGQAKVLNVVDRSLLSLENAVNRWQHTVDEARSTTVQGGHIPAENI
ncbi:hypothetical protein KC853_00245 [Candidatus Saccharibacteria bacterium]|nr:hypothetical protein [Candidatus Saccharibacteria bacterium]MCB9835047.1 hypothetical protein [Candidatus Nomurabacteria bacterium]